MTVVVSDTSPVNYLVLIGHIEVLPALFGNVLIPDAVHKELQRHGTPSVVRTWASNLPAWVEVRAPATIDLSLDLGIGEMEAIALARETTADLLLIDERKGTKVARNKHLKTAGTLAILDRADALGLLNFEEAIIKLQATNFHVQQVLLNSMLERVRARKKQA